MESASQKIESNFEGSQQLTDDAYRVRILEIIGVYNISTKAIFLSLLTRI